MFYSNLDVTDGDHQIVYSGFYLIYGSTSSSSSSHWSFYSILSLIIFIDLSSYLGFYNGFS